MLFNNKGVQVKGKTMPLKGLLIVPNLPVTPIIGEIVGWDMALFGSEWVCPLTHKAVITIDENYDGVKTKVTQILPKGTIDRAVIAYNDALEKKNMGLPLESPASQPSTKYDDSGYCSDHPTTFGASYGSNGWRCDD
jgi:hypothetical protein